MELVYSTLVGEEQSSPFGPWDFSCHLIQPNTANPDPITLHLTSAGTTISSCFHNIKTTLAGSWGSWTFKTAQAQETQIHSFPVDKGSVD